MTSRDLQSPDRGGRGNEARRHSCVKRPERESVRARRHRADMYVADERDGKRDSLITGSVDAG